MDLIVVIMLYGGMDLSALMITVWIYSALLSVVPRYSALLSVTPRYSALLSVVWCYSALFGVTPRCLVLFRGWQRLLMVDDTFRFAM